MQKEYQAIIKEYELVYDNYKITFTHINNLIKNYTGINIIVIGGLIAKLTSEEVERIVPYKLWLIAVISILVVLGFLVIAFVISILRKRIQCLMRMNFLRKILFETFSSKIFDDYTKICNFQIKGKSISITASFYLPVLYIIIWIFFMVYCSIWINQNII